jgi:hypothetical protein
MMSLQNFPMESYIGTSPFHGILHSLGISFLLILMVLLTRGAIDHFGDVAIME